MAGEKLDVLQLVTDLMKKVPGLRVDRAEFLRQAFKTLSTEELDALVRDGPRGILELEQVDKAAARQISNTRWMTSGASLVAGLPSNPALLPVTVTADLSQSFIFYIRISQELAYLYGEDDIFRDGDEAANTRLLLYIGAMFGVGKAVQVIQVMSKNAGPILAKKFGQVAVTKVLGGIPWRIAKMIAKLLGTKLTKEIASKGITKVLPVVGGVVSGVVTYATFGPMANRLKAALHDAYCLDPADIETRVDDLLAEDPDDMAVSVSSDIIDGVIEDLQEIEGAQTPDTAD